MKLFLSVSKHVLTLFFVAALQEFDKKYNPTWHCIVGRNFGSYVTHEVRWLCLCCEIADT
jgi:hypothetical protein